MKNQNYKMKLTLILSLFFITYNLLAQSREIVIVESETKIPIEFATIYYTNNFEGAISNKEGKFKIIVKPDTLIISHISFQTKKKSLINQELPDTIYLEPAIIKLENVTVFSVNLKEKLKYIYSNLNNIYLSKSSLKECTYKESVKLNNQLTRLLQIQLNWWSRNNQFSAKEIEKNNHFNLKSVDYSRTDSTFAVGYMDNKSIISHLYLDWYLNLLIQYSSEEIHIIDIKSNEHNSIINFETPIVINNDTIYFIENSSIVLNKSNGGIEKISLNCIYNNRIKFETTPQGESFKHQIRKHYLEIKFNQFSVGKMGLSYFLSSVLAEVEFTNQIKDEYIISQEFFITNTTQNKTLKKEKQIPINKPFFQNVPTNKHSENLILLNKEEYNYLNAQKQQL